MTKKPVSCAGCKHYYVTWDKSMPYGCHLYGFKSPQLPSLVIRTETQTECLAYQAKINLEKADEKISLDTIEPKLD